jgi:putative addiction module component (TIGR02574 family)
VRIVSLFSILPNPENLFGEMRMTTTELTAEILKLPSEEIVKVVEALLNRINPVPVEVDQVWAQEAERRVDAFEKGEISAIDGDFAMRSLKERLKD